jgi:hypothetical protein
MMSVLLFHGLVLQLGMNFLQSLDTKMLLDIWSWERFTFFTNREKGKVAVNFCSSFCSIVPWLKGRMHAE